MNTAQSLTQQFHQTLQQTPSLDQGLLLDLTDYTIAIRSNSVPLLNTLADYFHLKITSKLDSADLTVEAIETDDYLEVGQDWQDWAREADKKGRKETYLDNDIGRFIYKVKTGMVFWQNETQPYAFGPVEQHPNQVINFVLSQYLNHHLRQGWLLGHAAGVQINGKGIAIAGLSGGGKSTLMLHLLEQGQHFISNDRLLMKACQTDAKTTRPGHFCMRGIPKQPRINPGTIVHNARLHSLIPTERRHQLLALSASKLRHLEEKYDADVNHLFHPDCTQSEAPLDLLVVLNWSADSQAPTDARLTHLGQSPELLPALIKSPGPFFADQTGQFLANQTLPDEEGYLSELAKLPCLEITGHIDFGQARDLVLAQIQAI